MPLEEYVAGAIAGEANAGGLEPEVARRLLAVQALTARSYAIAHRGRHARDGFDVCDGTHCQVVKLDGSQVARRLASEAAIATRGEVIVFDGVTIDAVFHANCGGHTSAAHTVWRGAPHEYLQAVPDSFCTRATDANWTWRIDRDLLRRALRSTTASGLPGPLTRIDVTSRDVANRADAVAIGTREKHATLDGTAFRAAVLRAFGPRSLQSTRFSVTRDGELFVFTGRGSGHGVGLCQAGALARLQAGQSVDEVIRYYFRGVRIGRFVDS
jgi:stage II sporulation protein D